MQTTDDRKSTMSAAAQVLDIRRKATALVERDFQNTRSWMASYQNVGSTVGVSGSWLRKFIKGYAEVKEPGFTAGFNIAAYYARVCERIEADAQRRENNAATQGDQTMDQGMGRRVPATAAAAQDDLEIPFFLRRPLK